jgi:cytochrome P450
MNRIGRQILRSSKDEMAESGTFETGGGRDLLSLLVRANTAKDISESQRLSEEEVIARICFSLPMCWTLLNTPIEVPTFLVAGHETCVTLSLSR